MLYFVINCQLNSSLDKSNFLLLIDATVFVFKGLQIYQLSISFYKVYKLAEIVAVKLYPIPEQFCVIILYNIWILSPLLQEDLQLRPYSNLLFIKLIQYNLVQGLIFNLANNLMGTLFGIILYYQHFKEVIYFTNLIV